LNIYKLEHKFAILDDSDEYSIGYKDHLILTDYYSGITKENVNQAIEILI